MEIVTRGAVKSARRTLVKPQEQQPSQKVTGTSSGYCGSQLLEFAVTTEASKAAEIIYRQVYITRCSQRSIRNRATSHDMSLIPTRGGTVSLDLDASADTQGLVP